MPAAAIAVRGRGRGPALPVRSWDSAPAAPVRECWREPAVRACRWDRRAAGRRRGIGSASRNPGPGAAWRGRLPGRTRPRWRARWV